MIGRQHRRRRARRVLPVQRLEGLIPGRPTRPRHRCRRFLHPQEDRHQPLFLQWPGQRELLRGAPSLSFNCSARDRGQSARDWSQLSARYSRLALTPVSSATTPAAARGLAPASTRRVARRAHGLGRGGGPRGPPRSPARSRPWAAAPGSERPARSRWPAPPPRGPWSARGRRRLGVRGRLGGASASSVTASRRGDSNATTVSSEANTVSSASALAGQEAQRSASSSAGRALATTARARPTVRAAPRLSSPAATHARTSTSPGSDTSGMPASETRATTAPSCILATSSRPSGPARCARDS